MQIRLNNLRVSLLNDTPLRELAAKKLGIKKQNISKTKILRRAVDARRKNNICLVYHLLLELDCDEKKMRNLLHDNDVAAWQNEEVKTIQYGCEEICERPIVIGAGPAGLLTAFILAKHGYSPLLLERGKPVSERLDDVQRFWLTGEFNPESNVQFGEGGAGTFSDGKLTTRVNDPVMNEILSIFVEAGAPQEILSEQKPHVGTDKLRIMVTGLTRRIKDMGGEVRYGQQVVDFLIEDAVISGVVLQNGEKIKSNAVVLACGHSARDTYTMLAKRHIALEAKPFAVGVRIEHPQDLIDRAQYGEFAGHPKLGAADYALIYHNKDNGRTAYSFCMCPGGLVVAAASETGGVVTNGMSMHKRNSGIANSALVVNVGATDFGSGPLAGIEFQRQYERLAFDAGGKSYFAPAQTVQSFLNAETPTLKTAFSPTYRPGLVPYDLTKVLPDYVALTLKAGLRDFDRKIHGFAGEAGLMTGVETRTSAPVRILRSDEDKQSISHKGLYPAGEGAGYAGGIMSAALDGYHVARAIMKRFKPLS
ncbi:MAG: FAD-dependent protein [Acidaminococcaceae bacterium]